MVKLICERIDVKQSIECHTEHTERVPTLLVFTRILLLFLLFSFRGNYFHFVGHLSHLIFFFSGNKNAQMQSLLVTCDLIVLLRCFGKV